MNSENLSGMLAEAQQEEVKGDEENDEALDAELSGMGGDMLTPNRVSGAAEYAEAQLAGLGNDIFAEETEYNVLERINQMEAEGENPSNASATAITQQWEKDSRKDPEEEYFRLSCLALKIIYNE